MYECNVCQTKIPQVALIPLLPLSLLLLLVNVRISHIHQVVEDLPQKLNGLYVAGVCANGCQSFEPIWNLDASLPS